MSYVLLHCIAAVGLSDGLLVVFLSFGIARWLPLLVLFCC